MNIVNQITNITHTMQTNICVYNIHDLNIEKMTQDISNKIWVGIN